MKYLLFYREETVLENQYVYLTRLLGYYGFQPIVIDKIGDWPEKNHVFHSIKSVLADPRFSNLKFVWLDASGEQCLDEFEHEANNIVYCVGADIEGFDGIPAQDLPGEKVRLKQPAGQEGEWYASIVIPLVVYDHYLFVNGRRK